MNHDKEPFETNVKILKSLLPPDGTDEESVDFPQYRGLTFKEFWNALPRKLEFFDYEDELYNAVTSNKKIWVKKATGLGITEFFTRWVAWNCLKDDEWRNKQVDVSVIFITGSSQDLTNKIIGRIKGLFEFDFKTKESLVILNDCKIEAFPTMNLPPARGLNPRVVILDEGDFFPKRNQDEARTVAERYRAKGNATVVMVSTPNLPGGLFERMEEEEDNGYLMMYMGYERGLGKVFDPKIIEDEKRNNPAFEREYNLKYGFGKGNIFIDGLDECIEEYDITYLGGQSVVTADPAFGNNEKASKFGLCAGEQRDGMAYLLEADEFGRASPSEMLNVMEDKAKLYNCACKIDQAHPGFIRDLEERGIPALPVNFGLQIRDHESANKQSLRSKMTINAAQMIKNKMVRIHKNHTKLISQLRSAYFDKTGGVDKTDLNFDVGDAFIMFCWELKEFDYGHYDIMGGRIVDKTENIEKINKKGGLKVNVENFE